MSSLPVLDIRLWSTDPPLFAEQVRDACHDVGFFLLRHDLPPGLAERMLSETRRFFALPNSEKEDISYERNPSFRGYMRLGTENTGGVIDVREQVELATEYPSAAPSTGQRERCATGSGPSDSAPRSRPPYERLRAPSNPWPDEARPTLRPTAEEYVWHILDVARRLREAMCVSLGLDRSALDPLFGDGGNDDDDADVDREVPHWVLKLVSYPPPPAGTSKGGGSERPLRQGVGAHTDTNFLTLVLQDDAGGLQAFAGGEWIDVPAESGPDVLVCNLGEQAELLTRGYFRATPHRVLLRSGGSDDGPPRTSVPFFYNPALSAVVVPLDELPASEEPESSSSPPRNRNDEDRRWKMENNALLSTVGDNTFKSLARSHPEAFRRHHPDLKLSPDGRVVVVRDPAEGSASSRPDAG